MTEREMSTWEEEQSSSTPEPTKPSASNYTKMETSPQAADMDCRREPDETSKTQLPSDQRLHPVPTSLNLNPAAQSQRRRQTRRRTSPSTPPPTMQSNTFPHFPLRGKHSNPPGSKLQKWDHRHRRRRQTGAEDSIPEEPPHQEEEEEEEEEEVEQDNDEYDGEQAAYLSSSPVNENEEEECLEEDTEEEEALEEETRNQKTDRRPAERSFVNTPPQSPRRRYEPGEPSTSRD